MDREIERSREREMCYRRERLHERLPSLSLRLNIRCIYQYVCSDNSEVKTI
jgi:hypothetical protein